MKGYMRPRSRTPRSKRCTSCGKQVLLAGYDCHTQKCTQFLNHHTGAATAGDTDTDNVEASSDRAIMKKVKTASMKDFDVMMNKHGTYNISPKNMTLLNKVTTNTGGKITCKHCSALIPQNKYIKHTATCSRAQRSNINQSPTREAYFRTGTPQESKAKCRKSSLKRQTPFEMSKGRAAEFMKSNAFIQEAIRMPETTTCGTTDDPSQQQESRPESVAKPTLPSTPLSISDTNTHANNTDPCPANDDDNAAQIAALERKIKAIEDQLSPKLSLQRTIKVKVLPFAKAMKRKEVSCSAVPKSSALTSPAGRSAYTLPPFSQHNQNSEQKRQLLQCQHCNRTFHAAAFQKHSEICLSVFVGKRPFYDSQRARLKGTEMEFMYWKARRVLSGGGSRRPRSAPKTRRRDGTNSSNTCTGASNSAGRDFNLKSDGGSGGLVYHSRLHPHQHQQLQQLRSSTAPGGARRHVHSSNPAANTAAPKENNGPKRMKKKNGTKYYSSRKNYCLFSLRLNLFESPVGAGAGGCTSSSGVGSGGCRVVRQGGWREKRRDFREAINAARVLFYSRSCANPYKC